jgi:hypothetical protein
MEVTKESALKRLSSKNNILNSLGINKQEDTLKVEVIVDTPKQNTPPVKSQEVRTIAAVCAISDGVKETAKNLGLTDNQVRNSLHTKDTDLRKKIESTVNKVSELALTKTLDALGLLTIESISDQKPKDIAIIASNLAKVYQSVNRNDRDNNGNAVQFVIHAPSLKTLANYETVSL